MTPSPDLDQRLELHCDRLMTFAGALQTSERGRTKTTSRYVCDGCGATLELALTERAGTDSRAAPAGP